MKLSDYEYRNIIDYLKAYTTYDLSELIKKPDDQLYKIKKNIETAMATYPYEIFEYYKNHPEHTPRYSLEELKRMKYNQLSELRKALKIRKGKKVKTQEEAPTVATKARKAIKDKSTNEVVRDVIVSNQQLELDLSTDYQFITLEEAYAMYGTDITDEYLAEKGYKLYEPLKREEEDPEKERFDLIDSILANEIVINGTLLTAETLILLSLEDLQKINEITKIISKREEKTPGLKI